MSYYYRQPGEVVSAAQEAALGAAAVQIAVATLPSGAPAAGMMWAPAAPAVVSGVLTQQWTQVPLPVPTPQEQAAAILQAGCAVTSASTPALNATYPLDATHLDDLTALVAGISAGQGLPDGASTVTLFDATGAAHAFNSTQLVALGAALRNVFYGCQMVIGGQSTTVPGQPAAIP